MSHDSSEQSLSPLGVYLRRCFPEYAEADLEPTEIPGYWRVKVGCPGGKNCRHAFRGALGPCYGGGEMTIAFSQPGRDRYGRFLRPHRYWETVTGRDRQ